MTSANIARHPINEVFITLVIKSRDHIFSLYRPSLAYIGRLCVVSAEFVYIISAELAILKLIK